MKTLHNRLQSNKNSQKFIYNETPEKVELEEIETEVKKVEAKEVGAKSDVSMHNKISNVAGQPAKIFRLPKALIGVPIGALEGVLKWTRIGLPASWVAGAVRFVTDGAFSAAEEVTRAGLEAGSNLVTRGAEVTGKAIGGAAVTATTTLAGKNQQSGKGIGVRGAIVNGGASLLHLDERSIQKRNNKQEAEVTKSEVENKAA